MEDHDDRSRLTHQRKQRAKRTVRRRTVPAASKSSTTTALQQQQQQYGQDDNDKNKQRRHERKDSIINFQVPSTIPSIWLVQNGVTILIKYIFYIHVDYIL